MSGRFNISPNALAILSLGSLLLRHLKALKPCGHKKSFKRALNRDRRSAI